MWSYEEELFVSIRFLVLDAECQQRQELAEPGERWDVYDMHTIVEIQNQTFCLNKWLWLK